jgi:lipoprotein NlpD
VFISRCYGGTTRIVTFVGISFLTLFIVACQSGSPAPVVDRHPRQIQQSQGVHVVSKGETLYAIAWRYGMDYQFLAKLNGIGPPYRILPEQKLRLSGRPVEPPKKASSRATVTAQPQTGRYKKPANDEKQVQEKLANQIPKKVNISWHWPAQGVVINGFSLSGKISKGIDIAGVQGDPVMAAAAGVVVYSGLGMVGYGNLIIIKHDAEFLSAYAHNSRLLVKEGERVKAGQRIADMGSSGTHRNQLHFEIRRNGKPVDPRLLLPKK